MRLGTRCCGIALGLTMLGTLLSSCTSTEIPYGSKHAATSPASSPTVQSASEAPRFIVHVAPLNPYAYFKVARSTVRKNDFVLAESASATTVRFTSGRALSIASSDFPSRRAPQVTRIFLVRYRSLNRRFFPPFNEYVSCWAVVFRTRIPGLPNIAYSGRGEYWTAILVNALTGALQHAFWGHSAIG